MGRTPPCVAARRLCRIVAIRGWARAASRTCGDAIAEAVSILKARPRPLNFRVLVGL